MKLESASGQLHIPPVNSFISGLSLLPIILHLIPRHVSVWLVLCQPLLGSCQSTPKLLIEYCITTVFAVGCPHDTRARRSQPARPLSPASLITTSHPCLPLLCRRAPTGSSCKSQSNGNITENSLEYPQGSFTPAKGQAKQR